MTIDPRAAGDSTGPARRPGLWSREFSSRSIAAWIGRRRLPIAVVVGIGLRLIQYWHDRGYWLDEASLVGSIRALTPGSVLGPLGNSQLAHRGSCRGVVGDAGPGPLPGRPPAGPAALRDRLHVPDGGRRPPGPAGPRGLGGGRAVRGLGDLVYYASEAKQYSSDVASALACLLLGLTIGSGPLTAPRAALLAVAGASVVWSSHPSVFVLAAVGTVGLARAMGIGAGGRWPGGFWWGHAGWGA